MSRGEFAAASPSLRDDVTAIRRALPDSGGGAPYAAHRALDRIEHRLARLLAQRDACKRWHDD